MKKYFRRKLSIESETLTTQLRIISCLLFILPFTFGAYFLYEEGILQRLETAHLLVIMFILMFILSGKLLLRHIFEKFAMISAFMKKAEAGEMFMMDEQKSKGPAELIEISRAFNELVRKLDDTTLQMERLSLELSEAKNDRHRAEDALIPLKKVLDIMQLGVTIADSSRKIVYTNLADARLHGYEVDELIGRDVRELAPSALQKALTNEDFITMKSWVRESLNLRKDGSVFPVRITSDVVLDTNGECLAIVSTCEDITARKQLEETLHHTFAELQRHDSRMGLLHEMNDLLLTVESREEVYAAIINYAEKLFAPYSGVLATCSPDSNALNIVASWGDDFDMELTFSMSDCWAVQEKMPHKVCDPSKSLGCKIFQGKSSEPHFCLPLMAREQTLGLLQIISFNDEQTVHFVELYNFAITMSETVTLALSNLLLRENLREEAIHDLLTGLFNRRYLEETLAIALRNHQRRNEFLTVAMLDLDHFKSFNDNHGHDAGDIVLQEVGTLLRRSLRGGDIACRYGGEELTVILAGASIEHALPRLESIRQEIMNLCIHSNGRELPAITVSIGASESKPGEIDTAAILKRADIALYQAKEQGRNRVMMA